MTYRLGHRWYGHYTPIQWPHTGGPWKPAELMQDHKEPYTWRFWSFEWKDAKAGEHTIVSRAIDMRNKVQPTIDDPEIKLKKTFWEANAQWPRRVKV